MAKTRTLETQKKSKKITYVEHIPNVSKNLANKKLVREILIDCLLTNDLNTFEDVLIGYIRTTSKLELSKKTQLGRTTLYDLINPKKPFNPTLETIGKIFEELAA